MSPHVKRLVILITASVAVLPALALVELVDFSVAQAQSPCPAGQPTGSPPGRLPGTPPTGRPSYPLGQCQLLLSSGVILAGNPVGVSGSGFASTSNVTIAMDPPGTTLASATTDSGGSFSQLVTIPRSTAPGDYTMTATGPSPSGDEMELTASFTVITPGANGGGARGSGSAGSASTGSGSASGTSQSGISGPSAAAPPSGGGGTGGPSPINAAGPLHLAGPGTGLSGLSGLQTTGLVLLGLLVVLGGTAGVLWSRKRRMAHSSQS